MVKVTIRLGMDEPIFCPVLACEYCGGIVDVSASPRAGKLVWLEPPPEDPGYAGGEPQELYAVHMGCEADFRGQRGWPAHGPFLHARELPRLLAINLGIRDAHYWPEAVAMMARMGIAEREKVWPLAGETRQKGGVSRETREGEGKGGGRP